MSEKFKDRQEQRRITETMNALLLPMTSYLNDETKAIVEKTLRLLNSIEIEQEPKSNKRTIDADELLKRIAEKCKTPSLSGATVNGLCGATAIIYEMLNESEVDNADSN